MTQEEKELLLKDLCARLPYDDIYGEVYMQIVGESKPFIVKEKPITFDDVKDFMNEDGVIFNIKPYLRPMSSMDSEEIETYRAIIGSLLENSVTDNVATLYNFLNSKHLDYRGMIHMGLSLEAPEGMYNTKTE